LTLTLLFVAGLTHATEHFDRLTIQTPSQLFPVDQVLYVYEDTTHELGVNDLLDLPSSEWRLTKGGAPSYGFSDKPYWFSISIENQLSEKHTFYLDIGYAALDHIEVFNFIEGQSRRSFITGDRYPFYTRPINYPSFIFPFELDAKQSTRIIFKVSSEGPIVVPTQIWLEDNFISLKQEKILAYGAFAGILLVMSLYNFGLFASLREKSYLFYSLFTLSYLFLSLALEGIGYQFFWQEHPTIQRRSTLLFGALTSLFLILFTRHFLEIPRTSRMTKGLKALTILGFLSLPCTLMLPYRWAAILQSTVTISLISGALGISIVLAQRSQYLARLFLGAWFLFFISVIINLLTSFGLTAYSTLNEYGSMTGAIMGLVLLSLALGNRINIERHDKATARKEALKHLTRFKMLYDNSLEGIFLLDHEFKIIESNPRFKELTSADQNTLHLERIFASKARAKEIQDKLALGESLRNIEAQLGPSPEESNWCSISIKPIHAQDTEVLSNTLVGSTRLYEGSIVDISDLKQFERRLSNLALQDSLTGLSNRRTLESHMKDLLSIAEEQQPNALLLVDLDQFRVVNKLFGHAAGDSLLRAISQRLLEQLERSGQTFKLARIAGDEFCCFLDNCPPEQTANIAKTIHQDIESYMFEHDGQQVHVEACVAGLNIQGSTNDANRLIMKVQLQCQEAKKAGRNRIIIQDDIEDEINAARDQAKWIERIRYAAKHNMFALQIQEIRAINRVTNSEETLKTRLNRPIPDHFEVLLRLNSGNKKIESPATFLPAAERYGLMPLIDRWVIENFFRWMNDNPEQAKLFTCASINISMQSIADDTFQAWLVAQFSRYQIDATTICLELTESVAMASLDTTKSFINCFKDLGCKFALDDFGTGFSSYAYLKDLGVNYVKIDGVFIHNIVNNPVDLALVKSITEVAHAMQLETIAEYVEDQETVEVLTGLGVEHIQGYYVHKPEPLDK